MGAGRKTSTYDVDTGAEAEHARWRFESQQRLLGEKLGGVIFVCNNDTYEECVKGQIFGLPSAHWCYVQNIHIGMPMFLFNYSTRQLHGIWESTTGGEWKLNPAGWTGNPDNTRTMYPCQVGVKPYSQCPPLEITEYKPIMKAAYFNSTDPQFRAKFSLELTKAESIGLCQAFDRKARAGGSSKRPQPLPGSAAASSSTQRPVAAATASAPAPPAKAAPTPASAPATAAQAAVERPKAADTPNLKEEDFPALGGGSSKSSAGSKKPTLPKVDADGCETVSGKGKGQRGQAAAASSSTAKSTEAQIAAPQPAQQSAPQIKTKPASNNSDTVKMPEAPSTPPPLAQKDTGASSNGQGAATFAPARPPPISSLVSGASNADTTTSAIAAAHAAVSALDVAAADAIYNCFSVMSSHIQRLSRDQTSLAQALQASQEDNATLMRGLQRMRLEMAQLGQASGVSISAEDPEISHMSSTRPQKAILLMGGHDGQEWSTEMLLFHPQLSTVQEYDHVPFTQGYGGSVLLNRNIYVIGGGDGMNWNRTAYTFDLDSKDWFQMADMKQERGSLGVAEVGGLIYAMGGGRGGEQSLHLDTVEVFNPERNAWAPGPKLHEQRFTTSAAVINGAIYITGGFDGAYLTTAEKLDPRVGAWQPVPEMPHKHGSHMSAAVGDTLYVMGGWEGEDYLDTLEVFDTRAGRWRCGPPMVTPRAYASTAVLDGQIYVIGGLTGNKQATTVERYDPALDKWENVCENVPISRAFLSTLVVDA